MLFFSDNSGVGGIGDNRPLRGAKSTVFEGGMRVPAVVRWPAGIQAPRTVDVPLAYIDVLPTLMRVAGVADHGGRPLDGVDSLDVMRGKRERLDRELYSYTGTRGEDEEGVMVLTPEWKLVSNGANVAKANAPDDARQTFLFRVSGGRVDEERDVSAEHPDVLQALYRKAVQFRSLQPNGWRAAVRPAAGGLDGAEGLDDSGWAGRGYALGVNSDPHVRASLNRSNTRGGST